MQLSDQALGALMLALQNSLLNQTDIVPVLKEFDFKLTDSGLVVENPPVVDLTEPSTEPSTEDLTEVESEERPTQGNTIFDAYLNTVETNS